MRLHRPLGNLIIEVELDYSSVVAEGENASLREVLAEQLLRPEDAIFGPGMKAVSEESVDKDDAGVRW